jgi:uncharacterized membrane protein
MNWVELTLGWYSVLLIIGIIFTPLTRSIFGKFVDAGYPFAKSIGILLLSYISFALGFAHILPFSQGGLIGILVAVAAVSLIFKRKLLPQKGHISRRTFFFILGEELLFIASLFFLTYIRGQEPSIHSLEKFMDFGFMQSILRSTYFPPKDMWYAPLSINYYYFGHLTGAVLIKLSGIKASIGYNLILATIFAQGITLAFSLTTNIIYTASRRLRPSIVFGIVGSFLVNLGGNLHTIYMFTKGYPNDKPLPFWQVWQPLKDIAHWYNPTAYWYPNATRFIPYTIHEFPSYSYVVADLHGHVFDIPFVLLMLAFLFVFFTRDVKADDKAKKSKKTQAPRAYLTPTTMFPVLFGFMSAIHYMTNAFDGPIYLLLAVVMYFLFYGMGRNFLMSLVIHGLSFVLFAIPFTAGFKPFVSGVGVNCAPDFLVQMQKIGPFLFEKGNCQSSPFWMLMVLWGYFVIGFIAFAVVLQKSQDETEKMKTPIKTVDLFIFFVYLLGFVLLIIPEFFYAKDIYPLHFRANTMFKLGYQAFMMMSVANAYVYYRLWTCKKGVVVICLKLVLTVCFGLVFLYPFSSFPAYYGKLRNTPQLDGAAWMSSILPQDAQIVDYMNSSVKGQPVILEAQGDSYTDYERISAFTGLPTVAGWQVHEWLWRGSAEVVGKRMPDIIQIYESPDALLVKNLLKKYNVSYVVVSQLERDKYKKLDDKKFEQIGQKVYTSTNGFGALYKVDLR